MTPPELSAGSLALVVVGSWVGLSLGVSLLGWSRLAEAYRFEAPEGGGGRFVGRRLRFQSGGFRAGAGYNRSLSVGLCEQGLYLAVWPLLRIGHPPLLVPWQEIEGAEVRAGLVRRVELRFRSAPGCRMRITPGLAERIAGLLRDAAERAW